MRVIRFRPEAELEYFEAQQWYRERREGLDLDFVECVDEVLQNIRRNPHMYPIRLRHLRRAVVRRFPYSIYYEVTSTRIKIFAVFHSSRNPRVLQSRLG
jgi:plasmid stabilization system protein ParE